MSFFSKDKGDSSPRPTSSGILSTGGRVDELVGALVGAANDSEGSVRGSIAKSLQDLGRKQPNLVLSSCADFIIKNPKVGQDHRVILLGVMQQVLEMRRDEVEPTLAMELKDLAISEMTTSKTEVIPEWQGAASALLVSLGMRFPVQILDELMKRFSPGTVPHYFIMKSLGDLFVANALDTVPRLKEVLARVLPVLASVKQENMKWVFATGMGHFCDAVLYYVANIEKAPNKNLTVYSFSSDVFPAYEIMFNNWLISKEPKVRLATIQALGSIAAVLEKEQLDAQLPQLVPNILGIYKKEKEHLPVTQGFNSLLTVAVRSSNALEALLPQILNTIHPLTCVIPDGSNGIAIKNHNELLRCFQTIGITYSDTIISYLLERVPSKDVKIKLGTLSIIRHLITHMEKGMEDKKGVVVSGIKPLVLTETSLTIKQELSQIVIAMASHGYLHLEGGESLIEFIVQNCSISDDAIAKFHSQKNKESVGPDELRSLCDNILNLSATTIDPMHDVLWPYLFEVVVPSKYADSLAIVCKCLAHIGNLKREEEADNYIIDFDRAVNLPKPPAIIARLLVMVNFPHRRGELGKHILEVLQAIGPVLHPSICDMWDNTIPKLLAFLKSSSDKWNQSTWEDLIIRLLSETIKTANDDEWTTNLGEGLAKQIESYQGDPDVKRIAFKHLGLILQKSNHKEFIRSKLQAMLSLVDDSSELERLGCAAGFGYCAANHLDMTLEKVQAVPKSAPKASSGGGLFSSFLKGNKEKSEPAGPMLNNTIVLCYGYITGFAATGLITSRIEITILKNLKPTMIAAKSAITKECMIKTIDLIGKAMHPSHLKREYVLKQRDELITQLIQYMGPQSPKEKADISDKIRIMGLNACTTLINLEPALPEDIEKALLECVITFYALKSADPTLIVNLNEMLGGLLASQPTVSGLCTILKYIEPYVCSSQGDQREGACKTVFFLLEKFIQLNKRKRFEKRFVALGNCIAMLIPRCTDPVVSIRQTAIASIGTCLYIDYVLKQDVLEEDTLPDVPEELVVFNDFKNRIDTDELNDQFSVIHEMSRVLSSLIIIEELPSLLLNCLKGLTDSQLASTSGTCVVLNGLIKARGKELKTKVPQIISGLLSSMTGIVNEQTMNGTLHAVRSLASHHGLLVIDQLLQAPIPHSTFVVKSLQAVAKDESLVMDMIHHLFDTINNSQLYDEKIDPKRGAIREACHVPMSATCALGELMQLEELEEIVTDNYPLFLSSLLLRIGTANGMSTNEASEQVCATFKQFIQCGKETALEVVMAQDNNWQNLQTNAFQKTITQLSAAVAKSHRNEMKEIFEFLLTYMKGNFSGQRVIAATVIAEFVGQCKSNKELLSRLVNCLLSSLADPIVKLQALKGLGNIVSVGLDQANTYASTILDALMSSIDDSNETIAMEAMNGLSRVFEMVEEQRMAPVLVNICHRIHPAFDKENPEIRSAAFTLFGALHRFGGGSAKEIFYEQIHNNLPSVVLHVNDDNQSVREACKTALRNLAPLYGSEPMQHLLTENLGEGQFLDYPELLNDLSQVLINSFPERINHYVMTCVEYFKSNWNSIKANAATFVGFLLGNLTQEKRKSANLNPGLISKALISLLKEKDAEVRQACANAISLLHDY